MTAWRQQTRGTMMDRTNEIKGYDKGLVARYLLQILIKQGFLEEADNVDYGHKIILSVAPWQLQLLANFSEDMMMQTSKIKID